MKNFLLTLICSLIISFSFSQDKGGKYTNFKSDMKENSVKIVEYLANGLRLDDKQKGICMQAFAEYAHNMTKAQVKARRSNPPSSKEEQKPGKVDKKELNRYMLKFLEKRDRNVRECLKKRQIEKYNKLIKNVHPLTLNLRSEKLRSEKK